MLKTTLNNFIHDHYKLGYIDDYRDKKGKIYLQFDIKNLKELETAAALYSNIKIVNTRSQYAPELKKVFITLKKSDEKEKTGKVNVIN
jgi:hypothetical protein